MELPTHAESPPFTPPNGSQRALAFLEVAAVAVLGSLAAPLTLKSIGIDPARALEQTETLVLAAVLESIFTLLLIGLFLKVHGQSWSSLSPRQRRWPRETWIGLAFLPVLLALLAVVSVVFALFLPDWVTTTNPILDLIRTPRDVALFLAASVFVGGVKEEIQRAFALERFERFLGGAGLGLALWSVFFGVGHFAQGPDNAVKAAGLGLVFGLLYLRRRHLAAPIVCHAAFDILVVVITWWFA